MKQFTYREILLDQLKNRVLLPRGNMFKEKYLYNLQKNFLSLILNDVPNFPIIPYTKIARWDLKSEEWGNTPFYFRIKKEDSIWPLVFSAISSKMLYNYLAFDPFYFLFRIMPLKFNMFNRVVNDNEKKDRVEINFLPSAAIESIVFNWGEEKLKCIIGKQYCALNDFIKNKFYEDGYCNKYNALIYDDKINVDNTPYQFVGINDKLSEKIAKEIVNKEKVRDILKEIISKIDPNDEMVNNLKEILKKINKIYADESENWNFDDVISDDIINNFVKANYIPILQVSSLYNIKEICTLFPMTRREKSKELASFGFVYSLERESDRLSRNIFGYDIFNEIVETYALYSMGSKWAQKAKFDMQREAMKSAVSTIMARNMSHNVGSHILDSLSTESISVSEDRVLFKYIQQRMDYIAQISTEIPEWTSSAWFVSNIMRGFYKQKHLLDYIAKSEGLSGYYWGEEEKDNKIIIKLETKDNDRGEWITIIPKEDSVSNMKDIQLAIPGGVIGYHAFYTILENIIRNSAKHDWSKEKQGNLEITIQIEDSPDEDYVLFRIFDNVTNVYKDSEADGNSLVEQLKDVLREDFCNDKQKMPLHQKINCYLVDSLIDEGSGNLKRENWGIAEMEISAGYLNQRTHYEIGKGGKEIIFDPEEQIWRKEVEEEEGKKNGFIRAIAHKDEDEDVFRLGYEFTVSKPVEVVSDKNLFEGENAD